MIVWKILQDNYYLFIEFYGTAAKYIYIQSLNINYCCKYNNNK